MTRKRFWIFLTVTFSMPLLIFLTVWVFNPPAPGRIFYSIFGLVWITGMIALIWRRRWSGLWLQLPLLGVVAWPVWQPKGWRVGGIIFFAALTGLFLWRFVISARHLWRLSSPERQKA
ncbi:MAG TPA: hypothetical protein VG860_11895 [Terriglobia bacterium]|jgi:hypothetical protein|nr:hypothetical protein [Terriglobia bacterium]